MTECITKRASRLRWDIDNAMQLPYSTAAQREQAILKPIIDRLRAHAQAETSRLREELDNRVICLRRAVLETMQAAEEIPERNNRDWANGWTDACSQLLKVCERDGLTKEADAHEVLLGDVVKKQGETVLAWARQDMGMCLARVYSFLSWSAEDAHNTDTEQAHNLCAYIRRVLGHHGIDPANGKSHP